MLVIPVPGHTKGHTVLLYKDKFLFTGDHIAWDDADQILAGFPGVCWYSWSELIKSTYRLLDYSLNGYYPVTVAAIMQMQQQCGIKSKKVLSGWNNSD
ncbi:MAG: hypothetical protein CLLPBCKN_001778 [Chroococcidiopsis cubana SAG 39.79]|nr:hypothetical protein [Chroococcidiopsis cubana]MDZ4872390.1 hypothetical protein [Chroococcidiopsis cubana SAG 39.79]